MLRLLGHAHAWSTGDGTRPLPNTLPGWTVAFLSLQGGWVARERLTTLLWPDAAQAEALHSLRVNLHRVRQLLADWGVESALQAERRRVRLDLPTDIAELRLALAAAQSDAASTTAPPGMLGPLLGSLTFEGFPALREWADLERTALAASWREATLRRLERVTVPGDAMAAAQALLEIDPLDDAAMQHAMQALIALDRRGDAERQYRQYADRLQRELGVDPAPALRALFDATAVTSAPPSDAHAFVGRRVELAHLTRNLGASPAWLVTLIGPGGVGKSSLARQVLAQSGPGALWIDLQDLATLDATTARLAQRLGVTLRDGTDAAAQIAAGLGGLPRLVVLDNAEHLAGLGDFCARVHDGAPAVRWLVTSRHALGVDAEVRVALEGLARPDEDSRDAEAAVAFDAVRLFELRARVANPGFDVGRHVASIVEIVEAVGGLPLAIELAASWTRLLPPAEIARQLRETATLLERDPSAAGQPARPEHTSMRAVLERSWALLTPRERDALLALSVFRGGFTPEAARQVADAPLPLLASLADKGLLEVDDRGRFGMHPLVAADVAARAGRHEATLRHRLDHHASWVAALLESVMARHGNDDRLIAHELDAESANASRAWRHAVGAARLDLAQRMVPAWRRYFEVRGRYEEACRHFRAVADVPPAYADSLAVAHMRAALGHFLVRTNDAVQARPQVLEALAVAEAMDDATLCRVCTSTLGGCAMALGQWDEARDWFGRVADLNEKAGDRPGLAAARNSLALVASYRGDFEEALRHTQSALDVYTTLGNELGVARAHMNAAQIHVFRADWPQAQKAARAALQRATLGSLEVIAAMAEFWLGAVCIELDDQGTARKHLERARERCTATGHRAFAFKAEYYLARLACRGDSRSAGAAGLLAAARAAYERAWSQDVMYVGIFVAELLRDLGYAAEAAALLNGVLEVPDGDSDAGIRAAAAHTLASIERTGEPPHTLSYDTWTGCLATSDTVDELVARLRAAAV